MRTMVRKRRRPLAVDEPKEQREDNAHQERRCEREIDPKVGALDHDVARQPAEADLVDDRPPTTRVLLFHLQAARPRRGGPGELAIGYGGAAGTQRGDGSRASKIGRGGSKQRVNARRPRYRKEATRAAFSAIMLELLALPCRPPRPRW
jgi:hypothetical protein